MKKRTKRVGFLWAFACLLMTGANLEAGTFTVPPCAFTPQNYWIGSTATWWVYPYELGVGDVRAFNADFVAPLNLPNGITIKKITIYFTDQKEGDFTSIDVRIIRTNLTTGVMGVIGIGDTSNYPAATGRRSLVLASSQLSYKSVNNNLYAYSITASFGQNTDGNVKLHEIAISY